MQRGAAMHEPPLIRPTVLFALEPRQLVRLLTAGMVVVVALGACTIVLRALGHDYVFGLLDKFDLDQEMNIPTWYSSFLLLAGAALCATVALAERRAGERFARHWTGLAIIFLLLSIDEIASIHGLPNGSLRRAMALPPWFRFVWVIPAGVAVAAFTLVYMRLLWNCRRERGSG